MEIYIKREVRLFTLRYILLVTIVCIGCVAMIYQCETLSSLKYQYGSYHIQPPVHAEYEHKIPCDKKIQPEGKKNNHISLSCNSNSQLHKQTDYYPWDKEPQATHIPTIEVLDSKIADTRVITGGVIFLLRLFIYIFLKESIMRASAFLLCMLISLVGVFIVSFLLLKNNKCTLRNMRQHQITNKHITYQPSCTR